MMLAKFTLSITGGAFDRKALVIVVVQFLLPLAVLLGCAFFIEGSVLWAAVGMTVTLTGCAFVRFLLSQK